jgi:hypothetical protein
MAKTTASPKHEPGDRWVCAETGRGFTLVTNTPKGWDVKVERRRISKDGEILEDPVDRFVPTSLLPVFLLPYTKEKSE